MKKIAILLIVLGIILIGIGTYLSFNNEDNIETYKIKNSSEELIHKYVEMDLKDITIGSEIIVNDGEALVFVQDNSSVDMWEKGNYKIDTKNITLVSKSDLYYVSLKEVTEIKWGTNEIEVIHLNGVSGNLSSYGTFSYKVVNPMNILNEYLLKVADDENFEISNLVREAVVENLINLIVTDGVVDIYSIPSNINIMKDTITDSINESSLGVEIMDLVISNIQTTDDFEAAIRDKDEEKTMEDFTQKIEANCYFYTKDEGGRHTPFFSNYEVTIDISGEKIKAIIYLIDDVEMVSPGDTVDISLKIYSSVKINKNQEFNIYDGEKIIGKGKVN